MPVDIDLNTGISTGQWRSVLARPGYARIAS